MHGVVHKQAVTAAWQKVFFAIHSAVVTATPATVKDDGRPAFTNCQSAVTEYLSALHNHS